MVTSQRLIVISGYSSAGKTTLLKHLTGLGYATIPEPGRRVVAEERAVGGQALPWINMDCFARRAEALALADINHARNLSASVVIFDRGLVDAVNARAEPDAVTTLLQRVYDRTLFMAPPWPAIFENDRERRSSLRDAIREYDGLVKRYQALGYRLHELPKTTVTARARFVRSILNSTVAALPGSEGTQT